VEENIQEKETADYPEEGTELAQMFRVGIHPIGPKENLEVSQEVADYESDQDRPRNRHDHFLAD
jgi:hypothetical protein